MPKIYIPVIMTSFFRHISLLVCAMCMVLGAVAQEGKSILITGVKAHLGNGKTIENAAVGFKEGIISDVRNANIVDVSLLGYDSLIELKGHHLYPGFIAPNTTLGLIEIGAVRATHDEKEVGKINANARSIIAYNTDSRIIPTIRSNGILTVQVTPRGGLVSGNSSIVKTEAWNWEDAAIVIDDGIHLNWPKYPKRKPKKQKEQPGEQKKKDPEKVRMQSLEQIQAFFDEAKAYSKSSFNYERNLRYEAMKGIFSGDKTLFVHANFVKEITEAIYFCKELEIPKMVIVGGYDAWMVPELLKDNQVGVVLKRVHQLPSLPHEDIHLPFKLPKKLKDAGILFCLENSGSMETMGIRNLPFYAGTARTYGLTNEEAVSSVTLNAAKILGIDDQLGSIEVGKSATLIISKGDALDMLGNDITNAWIQGEEVDLDNHQKQLYRKFQKKYAGQE